MKAFCDEQIDDDDDGFDEKVSKKALAEKAAAATYCTQHWPLKLRAPAGRAKPVGRVYGGWLGPTLIVTVDTQTLSARTVFAKFCLSIVWAKLY